MHWALASPVVRVVGTLDGGSDVSWSPCCRIIMYLPACVFPSALVLFSVPVLGPLAFSSSGPHHLPRFYRRQSPHNTTTCEIADLPSQTGPGLTLSSEKRGAGLEGGSQRVWCNYLVAICKCCPAEDLDAHSLARRDGEHEAQSRVGITTISTPVDQRL